MLFDFVVHLFLCLRGWVGGGPSLYAQWASKQYTAGSNIPHRHDLDRFDESYQMETAVFYRLMILIQYDMYIEITQTVTSIANSSFVNTAKNVTSQPYGI